MRRRQFLTSSAALGLSACGGVERRLTAALPPSRDDAFLDTLQRDTFQWFWDVTPASSGLTPDRWPTRSFCSIAAVGFALVAYPIGAERGWISRAQAAERTLTTLRFFRDAPQGPEARGMSGHKGFFYHFLDFETGARYRDCELSSIDTTWLLAGALFASGYFDRDDAAERQIRAVAEELYARVDWTWMVVRAPFVAMGWKPESGFIASDWRIYDESAFLHFLSMASPTHPIEGNTWQAMEAQFARQWGARWGEPHIQFAPLFGHQYSHVFVDFRAINDEFLRPRGIDYFENSRRATFAQRDYATSVSRTYNGYGSDVFGLTACDGPGDFEHAIGARRQQFRSYSARGPGDFDDGTLAPTALGGSIPFAPEIAVPALKEIKRRYGSALYTRYGFLDAFNPMLAAAAPAAPIQYGRIAEGLCWVGDDHLGIDQGPIVAMIENWRTGLIWRLMRENAHVRRGLARAGFSGGWLDA
jgi:hypothetical protein